jgi:hypothetical protein
MYSLIYLGRNKTDRNKRNYWLNNFRCAQLNAKYIRLFIFFNNNVHMYDIFEILLAF